VYTIGKLEDSLPARMAVFVGKVYATSQIDLSPHPSIWLGAANNKDRFQKES